MGMHDLQSWPLRASGYDDEYITRETCPAAGEQPRLGQDLEIRQWSLILMGKFAWRFGQGRLSLEKHSRRQRTKITLHQHHCAT